MLHDKKPFMTAGSHQDFATHGRKRLLPYFGEDRLSAITEERVRDWLETMVDLVDAGEPAPKTVNNARTYLSVVLEEAAQRGLISRNPCVRVPQLPVDAGEINYLRLAEINGYLDACADHYRALAEFLIGSDQGAVHVRTYNAAGAAAGELPSSGRLLKEPVRCCSARRGPPRRDPPTR